MQGALILLGVYVAYYVLHFVVIVIAGIAALAVAYAIYQRFARGHAFTPSQKIYLRRLTDALRDDNRKGKRIIPVDEMDFGMPKQPPFLTNSFDPLRSLGVISFVRRAISTIRRSIDTKGNSLAMDSLNVLRQHPIIRKRFGSGAQFELGDITAFSEVSSYGPKTSTELSSKFQVIIKNVQGSTTNMEVTLEAEIADDGAYRYRTLQLENVSTGEVLHLDNVDSVDRYIDTTKFEDVSNKR